MEELEEEEVVLKAQNMRGNQEEAILAFNELIRRNYEKIYKIAYLSLNFNKEDAEDIVQMVATEVFCKIEDLRNPKAFKAWLYTILYNKMASLMKKRNKLNEVPLDVYMDSEAKYMKLVKDNIDEISEVEFKIDFIRAIKENKDLNKKEKATMLLKYQEDFSTDMISKIQKMNPNTVKTNLFRGRNKLKGGKRDGQD